MFRDLKPHPQRRASATGALTSLPTEWEERRIKALLREVDRRSATGTEPLLSLRAGRGLVDHLASGGKAIAPETLVGYKVVHPGELVMNRMRAAIGVFGLANSVGLVSPDYALFCQQELGAAAYLLLLLRSRPIAVEMRRRSRGMGTGESGFLRLYTDAFGAMRVPWPSPPEQAAIVKYLGHAHARIDRAIAAKRKLIALLEEQKQAIINQAVTRGLDPTVPMKDSGIPWLGRIPAHWVLSRVANEFDILDHRRVPLSAEVRGAMTSRIYDYYGASGVIDKVDNFLFDEPTILVAEDGANLVLRNLPLAIRANGKYWVNNHAHILRPRHGDMEYLSALLETIDYRPWITGAAQPKLTQDRLRSVAIAVPDANEQRAAIAGIRRRIDRETRTIASSKSEIDLLQEFRTRLTSDVVTGQLDVREIASMLPDFVEPPRFDADSGEDESFDELDEVLEEAEG